MWAVCGAATAGVILRPFGWPEYLWALAGAALLVALHLLTPDQAWSGIAKGTDVYLFLTGMMLLSELARAEGLFDFLAAHAVRAARGSAAKLFTLIYAVGTLVTVFLSNDATAVVLTPAVAAAAGAARADKLPYLFVCAFIANAASFVLPISNPANLVIYGSAMPTLAQWLPRYALAALLAIVATYAVLRWCLRRHLREAIASAIEIPALPAAGRIAALGIAAAAAVLLFCSAHDIPLGLPTALCGIFTTLLVLSCSRAGPLEILREISWGVLPLVAGLFVLVEAVERTGAIGALAGQLRDLAQHRPGLAAWIAGLAPGFGCNLLNNLPAGLLAGRVAATAHLSSQIQNAVLIGIDLGPNLSVTGSLATILWLAALRRDGQQVSAWRFLKLGAAVMPPALLLALAGAFAVN